MADGTKIEWATASLNPIRARNKKTGQLGHYCEHASAGCLHCYSETFNQRGIGAGVAFQRQNRDQVELFLDEKMLAAPLRWTKPRRIFWNSMTDTFADFVPDEWIDQQLAVAALTPQHTHLFLTKRAKRMREYFAERWQGTPAQRIEFGDGTHIDVEAGGETGRRHQVEAALSDFVDEYEGGKLADTDNDALWDENGSLKARHFKWPLPNVWLGVSVEDQARADERIPELLATPAAVRFISAEPLLGPVSLRWLPIDYKPRQARGESINEYDAARLLSWVIAGGESGPGARPMHPDWARSLRDQCQAAGVPFFFKQWGEWAPVVDIDGCIRSEGAGSAGALHDGRDWRFIERGNGHSDVWRIGKKAAGRLLDGREWSEMPG